MVKEKIVYIAQSAGGVAEYLYMFLKNFKNENYDHILIVSQDYEEQIERFKSLVKEIYVVPMTRDIHLNKDIKAIIKVNHILKLVKPNIVYLNSSKAGAIGRIALMFNFKVKILYNAHGWYFNAQITDKKKKVFAFIEKILAFKTDKIINISNSEYESALKYKIAPKKKMCIIENGIDFSKFLCNEKYRNTTRSKYNIKNDEVVIGVVGRLSEQKDPMTSLKAFELLYNENKNIKLMYVGAGELENEVLEYAKQKGIEKNIIITGWVKDVEKYIPAFDIAILPSKWEGFGLVIIEYMISKKPIVASKVGGIKDIIKSEENGILVEKENAKELADGIKKYLSDENLKKSIINNNSEYVKNRFDIKNVVVKHIEMIKELK